MSADQKARERAALAALIQEYESAGKPVTRLPGPGEPRDALPPPASGVMVPSDGQTAHLHRAPRKRRRQVALASCSWRRRQSLIAEHGERVRQCIDEGLSATQIGQKLGLTAALVRSIALELSMPLPQQRLLSPPPATRKHVAHTRAALGSRLRALADAGESPERARRTLGLTPWQLETLAYSFGVEFEAGRRRA